jgi:hypothetical protein
MRRRWIDLCDARWAAHEIADRARRQSELGEEPDGGAARDHVGEVLLGVSGDQYHWRWCRESGSVELLSEFESVLATEVNVDQRHVWSLLLEASKSLGAGRCHADDLDAAVLKQMARGLDEVRAVIND